MKFTSLLNIDLYSHAQVGTHTMDIVYMQYIHIYTHMCMAHTHM